MKLEQQVCSLELSKRLRELGVKQESLFGWILRGVKPDEYKLWTSGSIEEYLGDATSAYTVAELGEMLPKFISNYEFAPNPTVCVGEYSLFYSPQHNGDPHEHQVLYQYSPRAIVWKPDSSPLPQVFSLLEKAHTEADARAKMLIYLVENNLITV